MVGEKPSSESNVLSERSESKGWSLVDVPFQVYILRCADLSYYVGHCSDLPARIELHNQERAASWMSLPLRKSTQSAAKDRSKAGRAKREALINHDRATLKSLARCRALYGSPLDHKKS